MRKNDDYVPSSDVIKHVDAILKFMAVFTGDDRYGDETIWKQVQTGGRKSMDNILDDYINKGVEQGRAQGMAEERAVLVRSLCKKKTPEEASELLEIPVEEILEIIKE